MVESLEIVKVNLKRDELKIVDGDENKIKEIRDKMKKPFRIPLYQRPYEWDRDNVEALIKDIDRNDRSSHFIGNIVVEEGDNYLDVIDGQQRLTTLYLLCKIAGKDKEYFKLEYEVREEAKKFLEEKLKLNCGDIKSCLEKLKELENHLKEKNSNDIHRFIDNIKTIVKILEAENNSGDFKENLEKLLEKVEFSITFLPKTVDPVKYFETMNSRGKQLENHQVVKAKLLSGMEDEQRRIYAKIWDYCSKMDVYLEDLIQGGGEKKEIRVNLLKFAFSNENSLNEIKKILNASILNDDHNNETNETKDLFEDIFIISEESKGAEDTVLLKEYKEYSSPIRKFSIFLLHALKLYLAWKGEEEEKVENLVINDIKLIEQFEYFENKKDLDKEEFIKFLLKIRILFDYFIFKRDEKGKPDFYKKAWSEEVVNKEEKSDLYTNLLMIQLLFNVSSSQAQHWITAALWWLLNEGRKIWNENKNEEKIKNLTKSFREFLEKLDRAFAVKRLKEGENETSLVETINEYLKSNRIELEALKDVKEKLNNKLNKGTSTPHYWFYKLDYLLWKDWENILKNENFEKKLKESENFEYSKVKKKYRLSRLNSVEHIYPQSKADKDPDWKNCRDIFGNLALISNHMNSKLSDKDFSNKRTDKRTEIQEQLNNGTIESLKMLLVYSKYSEWNPKNCEEHHNEMINVLIKDLKTLTLDNTNSKSIDNNEQENN